MEEKDIVEIRQLIALYGHAADAADLGLLSCVFTEDAVWEAPSQVFSSVEAHRFEGLKAIHGMFAMGVPPNSPAHHTTDTHVREQDGQVTARSKWVAHPEQEKPFFGDYDDVIVRTPNGWRIKHRVVSFRFPEFLARRS